MFRKQVLQIQNPQNFPEIDSNYYRNKGLEGQFLKKSLFFKICFHKVNDTFDSLKGFRIQIFKIDNKNES